MAKKCKTLPILSDADIASFHSKYTFFSPGGCWEWQFAKMKRDGRGVFGKGDGRVYYAPRMAYFLFTGRDPGLFQVQHTCNNPACVCPLHLVLGTHKTNIDHMIKCGRAVRATGARHGTKTCPSSIAFGKRNGRHTMPERTARGETHGKAKLTNAIVIKVLALHRDGKLSGRAIARMLGFSKSTISSIIRGETWSHVYDEFY